MTENKASFCSYEDLIGFIELLRSRTGSGALSTMSVEYVGGGLPVAWRFPSVKEEPRVDVWPEQLFQTTPLDLSVRRRHCTPEPEMPTTGSGSMSAFKKSILKRYSK